MRFTLDGWYNFLKSLLQPLEGLRFDQGTHLRQYPNKATSFRLVELLVPRLAIDPCRFSYETGARIEGTPDRRALVPAAASSSPGGEEGTAVLFFFVKGLCALLACQI